jgi:PhnB protein
MAISPIPEGYSTVTPHLTVKSCEETIEFYKEAFGAHSIEIRRDPQGRVMHAVMQIGDSKVMMHDEYPEMGVLSPATTGGTSVFLNIFTADAQAAWDRAIAAGATVQFPLGQQFWGALYGQLKDPSGHIWEISQRVSDPSDEEILERGFSGS